MDDIILVNISIFLSEQHVLNCKFNVEKGQGHFAVSEGHVY